MKNKNINLVPGNFMKGKLVDNEEDYIFLNNLLRLKKPCITKGNITELTYKDIEKLCGLIGGDAFSIAMKIVNSLNTYEYEQKEGNAEIFYKIVDGVITELNMKDIRNNVIKISFTDFFLKSL